MQPDKRTSDAATPGGIAAVRGAITVPSNTPEAIRDATARLLTTLLERNGLAPGQIVSAIFTATPDLDADFPAHAARKLGWTDVPLLGAQEVAVPGALERVVRVLLTVTGAHASRLEPAYLEGAAVLRPDIALRAGDAAHATARAHGSGDPGQSGVRARHVAIIGVGQIGGSIGLALQRAGGWQVTGFDTDHHTLARAADAGIVHQAAASVELACRGADLAVVATPVDQLPAAIGSAAAALPEAAALLDTGSARAPLTPAIQSAARRVRAVGGHPITGTEGHGLAAARADLFDGASFALFAPPAEVPEIVTLLLQTIGARPLHLTPEAHDHALARTSHLPYLISCAIGSAGRAADRAGLSGPGFRSMTRLASSDARVAEAYCRANAGEVAAAWNEVQRTVEAHLERLQKGG